MSVFSVINQDGTNLNLHRTITESHFGANILITQPPSASGGIIGTNLANGISTLGLKSLRYPGGGVTETYFSMSRPDATLDSKSGVKLIPQAEFLKFCASEGIEANLVIKTSNGFTQSAASALVSGQYGHRDVDLGYLKEVRDYVESSLKSALSQNVPVEIKSFEIGNEFWGAGQMTAGEYGRLAAAVLVAAEQGIDAVLKSHPELNKPSLLVQSLHAGGSFSPTSESKVYVSGNDVYTNYAKIPVGAEAISITIPNQGSAAVQLAAITASLNNATSRSLIDGVVDHYYANKGLENADSASDYTFYQMSQFERQIGIEVGSLERYVTEWNTKLSNVLDNRGLEGAAMLTEIFYEMTSHGVDDANIWPLVYDSVWNNVLQGEAAKLTAAGAMFKLMSESLVSTKPILDANITVGGTELDIHGFSSEDKLVLFTNNRSDHIADKVILDLSNQNSAIDAAHISGNYFVVNTFLSSSGQQVDGASASEAALGGVISYSNGVMSSGASLNLSNIGSEASVRTEVTFVTDDDDVIVGRGGRDRIEGGKGNDYLTGNDGADTLCGQDGNDSIYGGGDQDRIYGGIGADSIDGGDGADILRGDDGADYIFGGNGSDTIWGGSGDDTIVGGAGHDKLSGGSGHDVFIVDANYDSFDLITDFQPKSDRIFISGMQEFGLHSGSLNSSQFENISANVPGGNTAVVQYDESNGGVYFDPDGAGAAPHILLVYVSPCLNIGVENFYFM